MSETNRAGGTVIRASAGLIGRDLVHTTDVAVVVSEGVIHSVGKPSEVGSTSDGTEIEGPGLTLLPGFIDAHVHIGLHPPESVLRGGVTTVRDLGWPIDAIRALAEKARADLAGGPDIYHAGRILTAPGGYPARAGWAPPGTALEMAGVDAAEAAVATMHDRGATVIKVALNPAAGPSLDLDTLAAIVAAAHRRGLRVTSHVFGVDELRKALEAGLDELAHMLMGGEAIPGSLVEEMVAGGMAVVPTLGIRFRRDRRIAVENLRRFLEAGGKVVYGTDLGNYGPRPGIDHQEIVSMAAAGMDPKAIIASATVISAGHLSLADRGFLGEGMAADIIAVRGDPMEDLGSLGRVEHVWRRGLLVK